MPLLLVTDAPNVTSVPPVCLRATGATVLEAEGVCAAAHSPSSHFIHSLGVQTVTVLGHGDSYRVPSCAGSAGIPSGVQIPRFHLAKEAATRPCLPLQKQTQVAPNHSMSLAELPSGCWNVIFGAWYLLSPFRGQIPVWWQGFPRKAGS